MTPLHDGLRTYFGFSAFRPGQAEAIQSLLSGSHTLAVMPTGAGKSLIFQLAALLLGAERSPAPTTLVISPLIALMKDQVDGLTRRGIPATYINSALPAAEQAGRLQQLANGRYRLVYVAPERLRSTAFLEALRRQPICLLAVDEAHCISEWGHDFRPDYLHIAQVRQVLAPHILTAALTATATPQVQKDILRILGLGDAATCIVTGFNRPNLSLNVRYTSGLSAKLCTLKQLLAPHRPGATIIYTGTRRDAEEVAEFAREVVRAPVEHYHAGLPAEERARIQEAFISGRVHLIVATNAFGMGIDRADVRQVIHYSMPGSLEAYYQEAGRAGRDGLPASATLLYDPQDRALHEFFIRQSELESADLSGLYQALPAGKEIWSTLDELSRQTGLHPVQIKVGLSTLERAGALEHLGDEGVRMMYRRGSLMLPELQAAMLHSKQHLQNRQKQLDDMAHYAESNDCRRKIILRHFGDNDSAKAAECCDNCQAQTAQQGAAGDVSRLDPTQRAGLIALDCIRRLATKVGREKLAQILRGSRAQDILKFHHDQNVYYGRLAAVHRDDLQALIGQLVDLGYIKVIGADYPVLSLTPRGENAVKRKETLPLKRLSSLNAANLRRAQAKLEAGGTVEYTARLFAQGLKPEQIARERALALSTIYGHLAQTISRGKLTVDQVVPGEVRGKIEKAIQAVGSTQYLAPIQALLPAEIDYNLIRCVLAGHRPPAPGASRASEAAQAEVDSFLSRPHPRPLAGAWSAGWSLGFHSRFSGGDWSRSGVGDLTYRLKYEGDRSVLPALVHQALELIRAQPELAQVDILLPVPSSTERKLNPVQVFCEALAEELHVPLRALVAKTRATRPQKEMKTLAQKRANVAGAFSLCGEAHNQRILLVDDLFNSGATLEEITRLLLQHGAARVNVLTLTRTIHSDS